MVILPRSINVQNSVNQHIAQYDLLNPAKKSEYFKDADMISNLSGENISSRCWTKKQNDKILHSRLNVQKFIQDALQSLEKPLGTYINASAGVMGTKVVRKF